jgi:hypothetical protein
VQEIEEEKPVQAFCFVACLARIQTKVQNL